MRQQPISPRGIMAVLALALLAAVVTGCGIGKASNEEKISKTATTYLLALADGDTAEACAQLTPREGRTLRGGDERASLTARRRRVGGSGRRVDGYRCRRQQGDGETLPGRRSFPARQGRR